MSIDKVTHVVIFKPKVSGFFLGIAPDRFFFYGYFLVEFQSLIVFAIDVYHASAYNIFKVLKLAFCLVEVGGTSQEQHIMY